MIKTDVAGSCEALAESLTNLSNNEVKIKIVRKGVGAINDDDVRLASISNAIIVAFHLMPSHSIRELAEQEGVEIKTYRVIYDVIEEIKGAIEGLLKPVNKEEVTGEAEIRQVFKIPKVGLIAGCMVKSGEVDRESQVRVYRDGVELGLTKVQSLKRVKDDVSSVKTGLECGIGLRGYDNIEEGDVLIFFKQVSVARTLADVAMENK
ncbi:translation initiation factor IF-2 [Treponema sp. R8-4-B8]